MTPTKDLRARLNELGVEHIDNDYKTVRYTRWNNGGKREVMYKEWSNGTTRLDASNVTPEQAIAATVELNKTTMKKDRECQYCRRRMADRKPVRTMSHEAWVNVEYRTLDIAVYGHEGFVPITHCPWCGREL